MLKWFAAFFLPRVAQATERPAPNPPRDVDALVAALSASATEAIARSDFAEAATLYRRALALRPQNVGALTGLGFVLHELGKLDEAKVELQSVVDLSPNSPDAHYLLGSVADAQGDFSLAVEHYNAAVTARSDLEVAQTALCRVLSKRGDHAGALAAIRGALAVDPQNSTYHLYAGNVLMALGDHADASVSYRHALALDSGMEAALANLVKALDALGNKSEALETARNLSDRFPDQLSFRLDKGRLQVEQDLEKFSSTGEHAEVIPDTLVAPTAQEADKVQEGSPLRLLLEGWRGVNHSFALINQFQILELLRCKDVQLSHRDLPYALAHWNGKSAESGFAEPDRGRIDGVPPPDGSAVDCIYRICSPFIAPRTSEGCRTFSFLITEHGLTRANFADKDGSILAFTDGGNQVVTSSEWSKARLVDAGLRAEDIHIVTCGVNRRIFKPLDERTRDVRRELLGIREDETVFLNIGAAFWNKGVDLLIRAFATLRQRYPHIRLVLKDQRALYNTTTVEATLKQLTTKHPSLFTKETVDAISLIGSTLSQNRLRSLYGVADCYVSPYRAEGFNLPVLEALACGTPVVVTDGGSTDDFCPPSLVRRLPSELRRRKGDDEGETVCFREPDFDALVEAMSSAVVDPARDKLRLDPRLEALLQTKTWTAATRDLCGVFRAH